MRVFIGPYTPWWVNHIHRDYMDKKYDYKWDQSNTTFEKALEKVEDFINWVYHHTANRYFAKKKRKIKVKIHNYDVWSMDNTLSHIILPMLKLLKEQKHGTPFTDREDAPNDPIYDDDVDPDNEPSGYSQKRWEWIMDQMIWSFEKELEDDPHKNYYDPYLPDEPVEPATTYSVINNDGTVTEKTLGWDTEEWRRKMGKFNPEKRDAYEKRKQLGFTLFGKYFQNLWD